MIVILRSILILKIDFYLKDLFIFYPKMMIRLVMLLLQLSHHCPCVHFLTCAWYFSLACSRATDKLVTSRSYGWPPGISDDYNEYYVCTDCSHWNYYIDYMEDHLTRTTPQADLPLPENRNCYNSLSALSSEEWTILPKKR